MPSLLSAVRALLAALVLTAIGQQLLLHTGASHPTLNFFSYFTNLANLFAAFVLLRGAWRPSSARTGLSDGVRYAAAVNMAVVGLVFVVLLRDVDLGDLRPWVNVVLHYVMPVAIVLDWLLWPPTARLTTQHLAWILVFPAAYLVYVLLRGAAIGWYPYPFLNPAHVGGYGGVALYAAGIFVAFLGVGGVLLAAGNRLSRTASRRQ